MNKKGFTPFLIFLILALVASAGVFGGAYYLNSQSKNKTQQEVLPVGNLGGSNKDSGMLTNNTTATPSPATAGKTKSTTTQKTATTTTTVATTPLAPPPRTPNPPVIAISYPSEMQAISMDTTQQLCVVDTPAGGDTTGTQSKHNFNDSGWTSYVDVYGLCLDPKEGLNKLTMKYRNKYGDESVDYTRQFTFHRIQNITISLSGTVYRDLNCNAQKDGSEANLMNTPVTINLFKMPEFYIYATITSDNSGNFSFSKSVLETGSIALQFSAVSPSGYVGGAHSTATTVTLNSSNKSATANIPQVPNENYSSCQ